MLAGHYIRNTKLLGHPAQWKQKKGPRPEEQKKKQKKSQALPSKPSQRRKVELAKTLHRTPTDHHQLTILNAIRKE